MLFGATLSHANDDADCGVVNFKNPA